MKICVDDIQDLMEEARRFTSSLGWEPGQEPEQEEEEAMPDFYEDIDPKLTKWQRDKEYIERKREWMRQHRLKTLRRFDLKVLAWLADLPEEDQGRAIWQMFQEGIILDMDKVDDMIADWNASLPPGGAQSTEARKMSDDVLDRWTQYLRISRDLFDDPDSIWEEEWPEIK